MPVSVCNAHAVVLGTKVYIGGGTFGSKSEFCKLLIYDFNEDSWDILGTPTEWYTLTTYRDSQLVLVGGMDPRNGRATNQLWVLGKEHQWTQPLPPMTTARYKASAISVDDCLIVAGGCSDVNHLDTVEVYDGKHWSSVQSLPEVCSQMVSTVDEGEWYLAGQDKVYHTSLESLATINIKDMSPSFMIAGTPQSMRSGLAPIWNHEISNAPLSWSAPIAFRKQLITVGGWHPYTSAIHAYSPSTKSWVHVGDLPEACYSPCTVVLPTEELLVVGGLTKSETRSSSAFRAKIGGNSCLCSYIAMTISVVFTGANRHMFCRLLGYNMH